MLTAKSQRIPAGALAALRSRTAVLVLLLATFLLLASCASVTVDRAARDAPSGWPVSHPDLRISSTFGPRRDPYTGRTRNHNGVDLVAPRRTRVVATAPGRVSFSGRQRGYGNIVIIDHGAGMQTAYAHLHARRVRTGSRVRRGSLVGLIGATGNATRPHLHYEVRRHGSPIDPMPFLQGTARLAGD